MLHDVEYAMAAASLIITHCPLLPANVNSRRRGAIMGLIFFISQLSLMVGDIESNSITSCRIHLYSGPLSMYGLRMGAR